MTVNGLLAISLVLVGIHAVLLKSSGSLNRLRCSRYRSVDLFPALRKAAPVLLYLLLERRNEDASEGENHGTPSGQ